MNILDTLRTIFEGKFGDILSNNRITLFNINFSKNNDTTLEIKGENTLSIDVSKATPEEKKSIKRDIIDTVVQDEEDAFLVDNSSEKTKQIKRNLPKGDDEDLLKFYKDKLKLDMYKALEASLMVRNAFRKREDITELKRDITHKYPKFGNNLCNLVSQDYFHGHFKELYYSMLEEEEFDIGSYQRKVEKIVKSLPYIVFIAQYKSYDELSGLVSFKLEKQMIYGTGKLLLHGLGRKNVETTLKILREYKDDESIMIEREINPTKTMITATLNIL